MPNPYLAGAGLLGGVILLGMLIYTIFSTSQEEGHSYGSRGNGSGGQRRSGGSKQNGFRPEAGYDAPRDWTDDDSHSSKRRSRRRPECPICQELLEDQRSSSLPCDHKFHSVCLRRWFQEQKTCPTCRKSYAY